MSACNSSGVSIIMTSAHLAASATSITVSFSPSAFFTPGRGLAQRDRHVLDAGIAQIQRMGMALAAIADDGDLLALDQVQVGVAVVVNAHDHYPPPGGDFRGLAERSSGREDPGTSAVEPRVTSLPGRG